MTLNELVKLTMLWTTGPWSSHENKLWKGADDDFVVYIYFNIM